MARLHKLFVIAGRIAFTFYELRSPVSSVTARTALRKIDQISADHNSEFSDCKVQMSEPW